ncbi:MAG: S9 family peptidase, partial [Hyphomonas sp.]
MRTSLASISAMLLAACASAPIPETTVIAETASSAAAAFDADAHLWLEEVEGEEALAWVTAQNTRTLAELEADPRYAGFEAAALEVLNSSERIPYATVRDGLVYNFWQDSVNVRGLWRRTTLASYQTPAPEWETILDFDRLAADEGKNWVYKGAECFRPAPGEAYRCLVSLSDGGKDAVINREFDLQTKSFVEGGFETPEAKQGLAWAGRDTLLVATDWGEGSLTESGYPFIVKRWTRGAPLESAAEVLRGKASDVGVWPMAMKLEDGRILEGAVQSETFFTQTYFWFPEGETAPVRWPIPEKVSINGIYKGQFLFSLQQDWAPEGQGAFKAGDLVAFELDAFLQTRTLPPVRLVFRPSATQAVDGVAVAKRASRLAR